MCFFNKRQLTDIGTMFFFEIVYFGQCRTVIITNLKLIKFCNLQLNDFNMVLNSSKVDIWTCDSISIMYNHLTKTL